MMTKWAVRLLLAGIAVFIALAALAAYILRDQVYQTMLDPRVPYQTYDAPPAPDHRDADAWAMRPDDPRWDEQAPAVFLIHPTTYDGGEDWNAPFDRPQEAEELDRIVLPNWAGPFAQSAEVFVPRYRQAALYTFMNNREDSAAARLTASADVRAAFDRFLKDIGPDRAFIVAGVGQQGGMHALNALMNRVAPAPTIRARLAAAYIVDAPVPTDLFEGPLNGIPPCESPDAIRCIIAFAPMYGTETGRRDALLDRAMTWDSSGELVLMTERENLCVNPLSWRADEDAAPARDHKGGAAAEGLAPGETPSPLASQTGARCVDGALIVDRPRSQALRRDRRLAEDWRAPDVNLFYTDIAQDAARRFEALAAALDDERTRAPDLPDAEEVGDSDMIPIDPQ